MLRKISPLISPELLKTLASMGHGDELLLADAHFPAHSMGVPVIRMDGVPTPGLLDAVLELLVLDQYVEAPVIMMQAVDGDALDPSVLADFRVAMDKHVPVSPAIKSLERTAFYERVRSSFAIVITGEQRKYGNILLKKGVVEEV